MSDQDVERLAADLADTPGLFAARRRKRAAAKLAALGTPEAMATLALALTRTTDPQVIEPALRALRGVREQPVVDAVAGAAVSTGDIRLATLLTEDGRAPSDPGPHAVLLFLAGHFDRYAELDFDGSLLRGAHTGAGEALRLRLAEKAREAGRLEWVRAVTGEAGRRPGPLSESEWEAAVGVLEGAQEWEELWRLASDAPSTWAARILQIVGRRTWRPSAEADRSDFVKLVRLADAARGHAVPTPGMFGDSEARIISASPPVDYIIITRDGKTLISGGGPSELRMWDLPSGRQTGIMPGAAGVTIMATPPDGKSLITGNKSGELAHWDLSTRKPLAVRTGNTGNRLTGPNLVALAVSPDGKLLASSGYGQYIQLWSLASGTPVAVKKVRADLQWTPGLAITPDGNTLVSGGMRGNLRLWELPECANPRSLKGHTSHVPCIAVTPDGSYMATGSYDRTVRLWYLPSGKQAAVLDGHTGNVLTLAMTPDGKLLASAGEDGVVRLWHLKSGLPAGELPTTRSQIECLAMSPDGLTLAAGSRDGLIRCWTREDARIGVLAGTPLGQVDPAELRTLGRSSVAFSPAERAWFDLVAALVRRRHRYDVELTDASADNSGATAWDVEIGDDTGDEAGLLPGPRRTPAPKRPAPKRKDRGRGRR